jgi:hypothetical protein
VEWIFRFLIDATEDEMNDVTDEFLKIVKEKKLKINGTVKSEDTEIEVFS